MLVEAAVGFVTVVVVLKVICATVFLCCAAAWLFHKVFGGARPENAARSMPRASERGGSRTGTSLDKLAAAE